MAEIDNLLKPMVLLNSSDLHLRVGIKPRYRLDGRLKSPTEVDELPRDLLMRMLKEILSEAEWQTYKKTRELDFTDHQLILGTQEVDFSTVRSPYRVFSCPDTLFVAGLRERVDVDRKLSIVVRNVCHPFGIWRHDGLHFFEGRIRIERGGDRL